MLKDRNAIICFLLCSNFEIVFHVSRVIISESFTPHSSFIMFRFDVKLKINYKNLSSGNETFHSSKVSKYICTHTVEEKAFLIMKMKSEKHVHLLAIVYHARRKYLNFFKSTRDFTWNVGCIFTCLSWLHVFQLLFVK